MSSVYIPQFYIGSTLISKVGPASRFIQAIVPENLAEYMFGLGCSQTRDAFDPNVHVMWMCGLYRQDTPYSQWVSLKQDYGPR